MIKSNISIGDAEIHYRNFAGKPGQYNAEGNRNFCVFLDLDTAEALQQDGWNVRWIEPKEEGDPRNAYIQVAVSYTIKPPKIILISGKRKTILDEQTVSCLDFAEIEKVDLTISPYNWTIAKGTRNEKSGVKAYVKNMYVTIVEDEFESKYYDAPDSAASAIGGCGKCDACDGNCSSHNND